MFVDTNRWSIIWLMNKKDRVTTSIPNQIRNKVLFMHVSFKQINLGIYLMK